MNTSRIIFTALIPLVTNLDLRSREVRTTQRVKLIHEVRFKNFGRRSVEVGKLGNVTSDQVVKEKQSSLVDTTTPNTENTGLNSYPPLPMQGSTPAGNSSVVLVESIRAISDRLANTAYGFFLGKRVAYPLALWMVLDPTLDRSLLPVKDGTTYLPVGTTTLPAGTTYLPVGTTTLPAGTTYLPVGTNNIEEAAGKLEPPQLHE
ncbi:hypothetical protein Tco_0723362 [Tanacetum coccineum]